MGNTYIYIGKSPMEKNPTVHNMRFSGSTPDCACEGPPRSKSGNLINATLNGLGGHSLLLFMVAVCEHVLLVLVMCCL